MLTFTDVSLNLLGIDGTVVVQPDIVLDCLFPNLPEEVVGHNNTVFIVVGVIGLPRVPEMPTVSRSVHSSAIHPLPLCLWWKMEINLHTFSSLVFKWSPPAYVVQGFYTRRYDCNRGGVIFKTITNILIALQKLQITMV